uniref:Uncharacterized protein n=1 Tax=Paramormyrops kingsleyae TaxID=1676925 RepID=A0A3B3R125_9TELE
MTGPGSCKLLELLDTLVLRGAGLLTALFSRLVSQMVIEEVSVLQTQLEIEKSCRENAEALATKVGTGFPALRPRTSTSPPGCTIMGVWLVSKNNLNLQEMVNALLEEKKQLGCQLKEQQREIEELTSRVSEAGRLSMMAAQEYEGLREQLDLEQSLRQKAESYAHEMLVKQKEANRQSMVLLQQSEPSLQLLKALEDLAHLTKTLEQERLQHQQKVKALEVELEECALRRQLAEVQKQMELLEEEKREVESRLQEVEKQNKTLENRGGVSRPVMPQLEVMPGLTVTPPRPRPPERVLKPHPILQTQVQGSVPTYTNPPQLFHPQSHIHAGTPSTVPYSPGS